MHPMRAFFRSSPMSEDGENRGTRGEPSCRWVTVMMLLWAVCITSPAWAGTLRVAVASNFSGAMKVLAERFERHSGHDVKLLFGSTGKHYAQIRNGAPFDLFFAADVERPRRLEEEGVALPGSRFTYAVGRVILWSPEEGMVDGEGRILERGSFRHLALANPRLAPYGRAAEQILRRRGVWDALKRKMVRGENVSQAFHFVRSGNAELGFVAYSQVKAPEQPLQGSWWEPSPSLYTPIEQQAVQIRESPVARAFLDFVKGAEARRIIREYGYEVP